MAVETRRGFSFARIGQAVVPRSRHELGRQAPPEALLMGSASRSGVAPSGLGIVETRGSQRRHPVMGALAWSTVRLLDCRYG